MGRLGAGAVALAVLLVLACGTSFDRGGSADASATAGPGCEYHPGTGELLITSPNSRANTFVEADDAGAITVAEHTFPSRGPEVVEPVPCRDVEGGGGPPTVTNVDEIGVTSAGTLVTEELAPGRSAEAGAAEIEVAFTGPSISILTAPGDDELVFGRGPGGELGANLNAVDESAVTADADLLMATPPAVLVLAGDGRNVITGAGGDALERPFAGTLRAFGGSGRDEFTAGTGPGGLFVSLGGNDVLRGGLGEDELEGGPGRDRLSGGGGADVLYGSGDEDRMRGAGGGDLLTGAGGDDRLTGGRGRDTLLGAAGEDLLLARDGLRDRELSCWRGDDGREAARTDGKDPEPVGC